MLSTGSAATVLPNMPDEQALPERSAAPEHLQAAYASFKRDLDLIEELTTVARQRWAEATAAEAKEWTITLSRLTYWRRSLERAQERREANLDRMPTRSAATGSDAAGYEEQAVASRGAAQAARLRALAGQDQPEPE